MEYLHQEQLQLCRERSCGPRWHAKGMPDRKILSNDFQLPLSHNRTHMAPTYSAFPFPKALFEKFVHENNGA